ncbi:MAG: hypothetical protein V4813_10645 [Gemmatimonadota bacterium]
MVERLLVQQGQAARAEQAERPERPEQPERPERPEAAPSPDVRVDVDQPSPGRIIVNGKEITVGGGGAEVFTQTGFPMPNDIPTHAYELAKTGIIGFTLMIIAFPVFGFLKALVNRRASTQPALPSRDTTDRLQRIEAAVDAMSVEVERISEGQRFVTRVLAERSTSQS